LCKPKLEVRDIFQKDQNNFASKHMFKFSVRCPHGFRAGQETETGQGNFPHISCASFNRVSSLRLWRCFFQPAGTGEGSAWGARFIQPTLTTLRKGYG